MSIFIIIPVFFVLHIKGSPLIYFWDDIWLSKTMLCIAIMEYSETYLHYKHN